MRLVFVFLVLINILNYSKCDFEMKSPSVLMVILIRNKEHTLPYFFSYLESIDYPKDRISLWIRSDHNEDKSIDITKTWLKRTTKLYHDVDFKYKTDGAKKRRSEITNTHWTEERFADIIKLKQDALEHARNIWADFIFYLDADALLTNPNTLSNLVDLNLPIVAPMLLSDGLYSNFWCGMSPEFYYQRTDEYKEILNYNKMGQFAVPMVHTAVLINLNLISSDDLTFDRKLLKKSYDGPTDDIIIFAISANYSNVPMHISNAFLYGYILVPLDQNEYIHDKDIQQLSNVKLFIINEYDKISVKNDLQQFIKQVPKNKMSLSHIYMINLVRRPERRLKMIQNFNELGLDVEYFPAVDGKLLNDDHLKEIGVKFLPGYIDPYHKRPMTMGEIGCFLSHFYIWEKIVKENKKEVLVLEDDIRFEPFFKHRAQHILNEARKVGGWDLIYFGRKRLQENDEKWIEGTEYLVKAGYSYWTLGYVISLEGAKKLLRQKPLQKLVPVDEYLPIMFDKHPNETWMEHFHDRTLNAWSVAPLLLFPTHYTGDDGYISDTEDSILIDKVIKINDTRDINAAEKKGNKENLNKILLDENIAKNEHDINVKNRRNEL